MDLGFMQYLETPKKKRQKKKGGKKGKKKKPNSVQSMN